MVDETSGVGAGPSGGSYLDLGTELVSGWSGRVFPTVGEAVAVLQRPCASEKSRGTSDPEDNRRRAGRRAKNTCRRYAVHNHLRRMWTLTYDAQLGPRATTQDQAMRDGARFIRALKKLLKIKPGEAFPYVLVAELHKDGQHYHLHVLLPDRFMPWQLVREAWGLGNIKPPKLKGATVKRAATYASKYVGKAYEDRAGGAHRYEVGQGCQPTSVSLWAPTLRGFIVQAAGHLGGVAPSATWSSGSSDEWTGPPVEMAFWDIGDG
jgi:hypothetical protein